jgi:hypothetical protein
MILEKIAIEKYLSGWPGYEYGSLGNNREFQILMPMTFGGMIDKLIQPKGQRGGQNIRRCVLNKL